MQFETRAYNFDVNTVQEYLFQKTTQLVVLQLVDMIA